MEISFYHCTRSGPAEVLPVLAEKAAAAGHRLLIRVADETEAVRIDEALWTYTADSFLPHGVAGGDHDAAQPILISSTFDAPNAATLALALGGGLPAEADGFQRLLYLFDAGDAEAVTLARKHWKALAERDGVSTTYWKQTDAGWVSGG